MQDFRHQAYFQYYKMEKDAYHDRVKFFEDFQQDISMLDPDQRIEIEIDYLLCLFEIGRYQRFLQFADSIIEDVIFYNIYQYENTNIYAELLFRKAACQYHLGQREKCENILVQLIRIQPDHKPACTLLAICKRKSHEGILVAFQSLAVVSLLLVLSITVARILLIEPFFDAYLQPFLYIRNVCIATALLAWISGESWINYRIYRETKRFSWALLNWILDQATSRK
jgi:tetratricopeptide (TPR) repeat protein